MAGSWARMHYSGRLLDGRVIADSRAEAGGMPKTFTVGNSDVLRCWDHAVQVLHAGDKATLSCPASLAYGKAYLWPAVGGAPIPEDSDIQFDIEIEDCNITPKREEYVQPVTTTMQTGECFYLQSITSDHTSLNLVLSHEVD